MEKIEYVLGFAFSQDKEQIVIIQKLRPEWQKGKINGVGGKIEETDLSERNAMIREFREEAGVHIEDWDNFATLHFENDKMGGQAVVHCFRTFTDRIFQAKTTEDEEIKIINSNMISLFNSASDNLEYLVKMALDDRLKNIKLTYK